MSENFDFDEHINRIRNQMQEEPMDMSDPDNSMFRVDYPAQMPDDIPSDMIESLPSDEPTLGDYAQAEADLNAAQSAAELDESVEHEKNNATVESAEPTEEQIQQAIENAPSEQSFDDNAQESDWSDPFGTSSNDAVKKYVIYIAKDFVPIVDDMDADARSAYVNEALQIRVSLESKDRKWYLFKRILRHIIVSIFTLVIAVPVLFWFADKSITATIENYSYVQKSFEKLYKERADRERAIQRVQTMRLGL